MTSAEVGRRYKGVIVFRKHVSLASLNKKDMNSVIKIGSTNIGTENAIEYSKCLNKLPDKSKLSLPAEDFTAEIGVHGGLHLPDFRKSTKRCLNRFAFQFS